MSTTSSRFTTKAVWFAFCGWEIICNNSSSSTILFALAGTACSTNLNTHIAAVVKSFVIRCYGKRFWMVASHIFHTVSQNTVETRFTTTQGYLEEFLDIAATTIKIDENLALPPYRCKIKQLRLLKMSLRSARSSLKYNRGCLYNRENGGACTYVLPPVFLGSTRNFSTMAPRKPWPVTWVAILSKEFGLHESIANMAWIELQSGLLSHRRVPSNFGWLEPEPITFRGWFRSLELGFRFHRHSLWRYRVVRILTWFLIFNGPNRRGHGAKHFQMMELELESWVPAPQLWLQHARLDSYHSQGTLTRFLCYNWITALEYFSW